MAGRIFVEADEAEFGGLPIGAQHLYLVYRGDDGEEFVIRSGPPDDWPLGDEMRIEANVPMHRSADDRGDETPEDRHSTELAFAGLTADEAWAIMVKYARALDDADYPYRLLTTNSNALVGAMLDAAGGDPDGMRPDGIGADEAVGYASWDDIVEDVAPPADGIFRGTAGADRLAGMQIGEIIRGLAGRDVVRASRGDDMVDGGAGADRLTGQDGDDTLRGGLGDDILRGGLGDDMLDGGAGRDRLIGGAGADRFVFIAATSPADGIEDFEDGADHILFGGTASYDDLTVSRFGDAGQHTLVGFGGSAIELRDFDRDLLDAGDFLFPVAGALLA